MLELSWQLSPLFTHAYQAAATLNAAKGYTGCQCHFSRRPLAPVKSNFSCIVHIFNHGFGAKKNRKRSLILLWTAASIGGALRSSGGDLLVLFSNLVGMKDSNEAEVLAILEALPIFFSLFPTAAHGGE
ncbi:hypothetical protein AAC387_Pa03g1166 [Persea americana]